MSREFLEFKLDSAGAKLVAVDPFDIVGLADLNGQTSRLYVKQRAFTIFEPYLDVLNRLNRRSFIYVNRKEKDGTPTSRGSKKGEPDSTATPDNDDWLGRVGV